MKYLPFMLTIILGGFFIYSCSDEAAPPSLQDQFETPYVPDYIAERMSAEDVIRFKQGPTKAQLLLTQGQVNADRKWHPVLMTLGYDLQIGPIGGNSCSPGDFAPCFGPGASEESGPCLSNVVGAAGITRAEAFEGHTFNSFLRSEYYPVFCAPDYSGYGSGFYEIEGDRLVVEAENSGFEYDMLGNSQFYRNGTYMGEESTGRFEGVIGWETMISHTDAQRNPANSPNGLGHSEVVIFGWAYW